MWRRYARTDDLVLKEYSGFVEPRAWFDYELAAGDVEERLSVLTGWVLQAKQNGQEFGLRLPGLVIEPGVGDTQVTRALEALAVFGMSEPDSAGMPSPKPRTEQPATPKAA